MQHKIIYGIFGGLWSSLVRSCRKEHGRCQHCCESCMSACVAAIPCCVCCDHRIISFWRAAQFRQKSCSLSWQINIKSQKGSASGLFGLAFNFFFFSCLTGIPKPLRVRIWVRIKFSPWSTTVSRLSCQTLSVSVFVCDGFRIPIFHKIRLQSPSESLLLNLN